MDFTLTNEQRIAVDSFRRLLDREIAPRIAGFDDAFIPRDAMQELLQALLPFGMGNGLVGEAEGGLGLDPLTVGLLFEELARVSPDLAIVVLIQMEAGLLLAAGSESIRDKYLAPLLRGEKFGCIGISEPGAGSNIAELRCRARRDGKGYALTRGKTVDFQRPLFRFLHLRRTGRGRPGRRHRPVHRRQGSRLREPQHSQDGPEPAVDRPVALRRREGTAGQPARAPGRRP